MKTFQRIAIALIALLAPLSLVEAQTALTQTTLSGAVTLAANRIQLASVTGVTANSTILYVDSEAMSVYAVSGKYVSVVRGFAGTKGATHASAAVVWAGSPSQFATVDPVGSCTAGSTNAPTIAFVSARFWRCDATTGVWQPFFTTGSITPTATTGAVGTYAQTFTVNGLISSEPIVIVNAPASTSLCPLTGARVTAANTVSLYFSTLTAAACTPAAGTYNFTVPRFN